MPPVQDYDLTFIEQKPLPAPKDVVIADESIKGRWPRMLRFDVEVKDRLVKFLDSEIGVCYTERQPLLDDWKQWQSDYWGRPESAIKLFPYRKAANFVVPLSAIAVEAIYARLMNTIFSVKPLWSIRPRSKSWIEAAKPFERFLQTEVENENALNAYPFFSSTLLELIKLGTCVGKSGYTRQTRKSLRVVPGGGDEEPFYVQVKNSATLDYVPCANFLMRLSELDPQEAVWCGEEHDWSWSQLKRMVLDGRMYPDAAEGIKTYWTSQTAKVAGSGREYQEHLDRLQNTEPMWNDHFTTQEIWLSFDVDGDNIDEEIVVDFHRESRTVLSARYNWYADLHRPYRICQYIPVEGRWAGIGVGKQNEQFQRAVTTIHRQRLDNATLANMGMLKVKKTTGYTSEEPIFPGKMWFVDDHNDIIPFKMSEIYQSSYANEQAIVGYSERRTGANDVILGAPHEGTPGTATSDLARLAEGNKKYDLVLKNTRRWAGFLGGDVVANYQQFGDQGRHWLMEEEKGQFIEAILTMPQELVMHGAIIELTVTDSITNREVEQRQWMSLFQIITNYYQTTLQFAQVSGDPALFSQLGMRALMAADEAMKRLLETFNVPSTDRLLLTGGEEQNGGPAQGGPGAGPQGADGPVGVAGLLTGVGAGGGGAATVSPGG